jgi:hypothetical protein
VVTTAPTPANWPAEPIYLLDVSAENLYASLATTIQLNSVLRCGPLPA